MSGVYQYLRALVRCALVHFSGDSAFVSDVVAPVQHLIFGHDSSSWCIVDYHSFAFAVGVVMAGQLT